MWNVIRNEGCRWNEYVDDFLKSRDGGEAKAKDMKENKKTKSVELM